MIDPLDKILDKLNNDDLLSDLSDSEENNIEEIKEEEIDNMREKILETYNEIKKCCIEIFMGYLILIDTNDHFININHNKLDILDKMSSDENKILDKYERNKIKLQRLNNMYFGNLINDLKQDNILNIPEFIKLFIMACILLMKSLLTSLCFRLSASNLLPVICDKLLLFSILILASPIFLISSLVLLSFPFFSFFFFLSSDWVTVFSLLFFKSEVVLVLTFPRFAVSVSNCIFSISL